MTVLDDASTAHDVSMLSIVGGTSVCSNESRIDGVTTTSNDRHKTDTSMRIHR